jgi:hypothetical protein
MSMNNKIKLELIGPNHTLAYLIFSGRYQHPTGHSDDISANPRYKNLISETKTLSLDYNNE